MPLNPQTIGELLQAREGRTFRAPEVQIDERLLAPTQRRNVLVRALRGLARAPARLSGYPVAQYPRTPAPTGEQFAEGMSDPDTADYYRELLRQAYGLQVRTPMETERRQNISSRVQNINYYNSWRKENPDVTPQDDMRVRLGLGLATPEEVNVPFKKDIIGTQLEAGTQLEGTKQTGRQDIETQKQEGRLEAIRLSAALRKDAAALKQSFDAAEKSGQRLDESDKKVMDLYIKFYQEAEPKDSLFAKAFGYEKTREDAAIENMERVGFTRDALERVAKRFQARAAGAIAVPQAAEPRASAPQGEIDIGRVIDAYAGKDEKNRKP